MFQPGTEAVQCTLRSLARRPVFVRPAQGVELRASCVSNSSSPNTNKCLHPSWQLQPFQGIFPVAHCHCKSCVIGGEGGRRCKMQKCRSAPSSVSRGLKRQSTRPSSLDWTCLMMLILATRLVTNPATRERNVLSTHSD